MSSASSKTHFTTPWSPALALFGIGLILAAQIGAVLIVEPRTESLQIFGQVSSSVVANFLLFGVSTLAGLTALGLLVWSFRGGLQDLGLRKFRLVSILRLIPAALGYLGLSILVTFVATLLFPSIDIDQAQDLGFKLTQNRMELLLVFTSLVILPPLAEEPIFRGWLFGGLRSRWSFLPSAILASLIFGAVHFQINIALDTFALGLALCWLYETSRSLWPSLMLHAIKNGLAFALIFIYGL